MKIAICGGTFDPIHRGHLDPVLAVRDAMQWTQVFLVPAFVQPFKVDRSSASGYHRFAMAVLATADLDGFLVSPRELERGAVSYSVDTLEEVRSEHPGATLDWIIGDDNLTSLMQWKSIDRILELANFVVLRREGGAVERRSLVPGPLAGRVAGDAAARGPAGSIVFADNELVPVSSTEIRRRVRAGEPIGELVSAPVSRYIDRYALYRKGNS